MKVQLLVVGLMVWILGGCAPEESINPVPVPGDSTGCADVSSSSGTGGSSASTTGSSSTATTATTATSSSSSGAGCTLGACSEESDCCALPASQDCRVTACVAGMCERLPVPTGERCGEIGGVPHSCDGLGACVTVVPPVCKVPVAPAPERCGTGCDDGNECTTDYCAEDTTTCLHAARASGLTCGGDGESTCRSGYCCETGHS